MENTLTPLRSGIVWGAAGLWVFLALFNTFLIALTPGWRKMLALALAASGLTVGSAWAGFRLVHGRWVILPVSVLGMLALGEIRRIYLRRVHAGTRPIGTIPHRVPLANPFTTAKLVLHRYEVPHGKWRGKPLRIVHLTDLHVHPGMPLEYYQDAIATAERAQADIAVLTGDFITRTDGLPVLRQMLRPIGRVATFAVLGNHDYWADPDAVRAVLKDTNIRLLANETVELAIDDRSLGVSGLDFPWGGREPEHREFSSKDRLQLVLSHTPDNIYRLARRGADVVFSGHYHAGHIRLPWIGPVIIPSIYGRRFDHGHFVVNGTHLFVASGVGSGDRTPRIYCEPDIFVVDIVGERQAP